MKIPKIAPLSILGIIMIVIGILIASGVMALPLAIVQEPVVQPLTWVLVPDPDNPGSYRMVNVTRSIDIQGNTATFSFKLYYSSVGWVGGYGRVLACSKNFFITAYDANGKPIRWIPYDTILVTGSINFHIENNTIVVDQAVFNVEFSNGTYVPRTLFNNLDYILVSPDGVSYAVQVDDPGYAFAVGLALVNKTADYGDIVVSNVYASPWWIRVFELIKGVPQLIREYSAEGIVYWNSQPYTVTPSPPTTTTVTIPEPTPTKTTTAVTITTITTEPVTPTYATTTTYTATATTTVTLTEQPAVPVTTPEERRTNPLVGVAIAVAGTVLLALSFRRTAVKL